MDNAAFHKTEVLNLAGKYSQTLVFLPPDSLECLPIEHTWSDIKRNIASQIHRYSSVAEARVGSTRQLDMRPLQTLRRAEADWDWRPCFCRRRRAALSFLSANWNGWLPPQYRADKAARAVHKFLKTRSFFALPL